MTTMLDHAADHLLQTLLTENAALARLDLATATALLPRKTEAASAFQSAFDAQPPSRTPAFAAALNDAANENRRLLERAMTVQTRVLGILAQAARADAPCGPAAYGHRGMRVPAAARPAARPWALNASA